MLLISNQEEDGVGFSQSFFNLKRKVCCSQSNVKKRAKKCISYTTDSYALSKIDQESIPTTDREKDALLEAGLGEQKIVIPDIDINPFVPKLFGRERKNLIFYRRIEHCRFIFLTRCWLGHSNHISLNRPRVWDSPHFLIEKIE